VTRVAAVDLGTNTTRLLVADVDGGRVEERLRRGVVTGLGEAVDAERRLRPAATERVHAVLAQFRREADALRAERVLAAGTSAIRDARDGREFLRDVERRYGFATRLLTGDEEAELTRRGVGAVDERTLLLDVGGGSTELILGPVRASLDIGSVRLTDRYLRHDPPARDELSAAAASIRSVLPALDPADAVGVAGTVWQLQALVGAITPASLERELARLASLRLAERRRVPGLDPARAPVIVAGALIVAEVMRRYDLTQLAYSIRDLLDGLALEAARRA
jgi:exopolyphosphatase/guanosine-5'-triphosphate,3'-diphosphate pyrophosphatase